MPNNYILTSQRSFMSEDELYHWGVKGMKWGVRRFQNEDGSLTNAGQKRYDKMEAYRTKLANKAKKKSDALREQSNEARRNVADLKRNGTKSKAYQDWKEQQDSDREWEYEKKNSFAGLDGNLYVRKYERSSDRFLNDVDDYLNSKTRVKELIDENKIISKSAKQEAKRWMASNEKLMNMEVSALTKKRDIKKVYRS